jgi:hypothetical protein
MTVSLADLAKEYEAIRAAAKHFKIAAECYRDGRIPGGEDRYRAGLAAWDQRAKRDPDDHHNARAERREVKP